ncbi:MAG: RNA polymerase sigma factor, partial [Sphingopyxis sp.]
YHSADACDAGEGTSVAVPSLSNDAGTWFEREILPHRASLEKYLARCFPHEADLEDIVQQSFERVLARSGDEPIENPKFYLRRTAWSLLQSRMRRRAIASIDHFADLSSFDFQCDAPLPDHICAAREEFAIFLALYSELPPRAQAAIQQIRLEGRSYVEVAESFDLCVSSVAKQIRRSLRELRAGLETAGFIVGDGQAMAEDSPA